MLDTETTIFVALKPGVWIRFTIEKVIDDTIPDIMGQVRYRREIPRLTEIFNAVHRLHEGVAELPQ